MIEEIEKIEGMDGMFKNTTCSKELEEFTDRNRKKTYDYFKGTN
ncbi:MAG: hypothetical protein ACTSVK_07295 [Promethearchaeota archaeon]